MREDDQPAVPCGHLHLQDPWALQSKPRVLQLCWPKKEGGGDLPALTW